MREDAFTAGKTDGEPGVWRRLAARDFGALRSMVESHELAVYRFARRLVAPDEAEAVVAETFAKAWETSRGVSGDADPRVWLLGVAWRLVDERRRARRDDPWRARDGGVAAYVATSGGASRADDALARALDELTTEHRAVVDLVYGHETAVPETAAILALTERGVLERLLEARSRWAELAGEPSSPSDLSDVEALLPWSATGRLDRRRAGAVSDVLAHHPASTANVARVERERAAATALHDAIRMPCGSIVATIMARARGPLGPWGAVKSFFVAPTPGGVRWAAAVAILIVLAQAALIAATYPRVWWDGKPPPANTQGAFAIVRFVEGAPFGIVAETLAGIGVTLAGGPGPGGVFKVRLGPPDMIEKMKNKKILALRRRRDVVRFVMPGSPKPES